MARSRTFLETFLFLTARFGMAATSCAATDLFADTKSMSGIVRNSAREARKYTLGWAEDILKELLNLVDIRLDLAIEGHKGRVRPRRQVLEVCGLPGRGSREPDQRVAANTSPGTRRKPGRAAASSGEQLLASPISERDKRCIIVASLQAALTLVVALIQVAAVQRS